MKTYFYVLLASLCLFEGTGFLWGAASPTAPAQIQKLPEPEPCVVTSRDANSRVWERTIYEKAPNGQIISRKVHYTELASGMHYKNTENQWTESKEYIEAYTTGAIARQGQYQVIFANNLNSAGAIDLRDPNGKRLRSNILGLGYYDSSTGQSVLIAQIQDSQGELTADNVVLYPNAFDGVKADVRYTYKKGSFEQDVILREQPPAPEKFGLNPETTELEVMTEFINPPEESIKEYAARSGNQADQDISWGAMRLGHGKVFDLSEGQSQKSAAQVMRQYVSVDGRKILLEKVKLPNIDASLSKLPRQASINSNLPKTASKTPRIPKAPLALVQPKPMKLAVAAPSNKGYVLDYVLLNTDQTNFTFKGDESYRVKDAYNLSGVTTFEGGTVIKCNQDGQINIDSSGTIVCKTSAYRPAVFTSNNDDGIGAPGFWIGDLDTEDPYYTGHPNYWDVNTFLNINCSNSVLRNMRFCYANQAVNVNASAGSIELWNCQFANMYYGLWASDVNVGLHNVLINEVVADYPVVMLSSGNFTAENVTSDGCILDNGLVYVENAGIQSVMITNSIVTYGQHVSVNGGAFTVSANPIYQVVGGGSYYLTNNSPYRNAGTTNISPDLLAELGQKTTYPPLVSFENTTISTNTTLSPRVQRDTDTPDLGYHYDPLDYVIVGSDLTTNLTITAGTAVGFYDIYGTGLTLSDGANLTINGTASAPCWVTEFKDVQEGGNGNWPGSLGTGVIVFNGSGDSPIPQVNATFTKWPAFPVGDAHLHDTGNFGVGTFSDCEFYGAGISSYRTPLYFTNCLFGRVVTCYWASEATSFTYQNCTFYDGWIAMCRYVGQADSFWTIKNTMFDGTSILYDDNFHASTNHTYFDYNAYNTNNTSWVTYTLGYPSVGTLETNGPNDVIITNVFNWKTSWLGDFYQPTNSVLINKGSTTANLLGMYHFTTQTNQVKEANSTVDIGYHYMAVDSNGSPIDTDGDGTPDYLEDLNGNGIVDNGESQWGIRIITQPVSQTVIQGTNATFNVTIAGLTPLHYQWSFNGTNLSWGTEAVLTVTNVQPDSQGYYQVIVTNTSGSVTSAIAVLTLACNVASSGLVGWWRGDGNASDAWGTNNGIFQGENKYTNGVVNQGFYLNGTNAYVEIPDSSVLKPTNVTVEAWVRLDKDTTPFTLGAGSAGLQYIVFKKNSRSGNFEGYVLSKSGTSSGARFNFNIASASSTQIGASSTTVPQLGVWYHLAGTYDGSDLKLYVNGVMEATNHAGFPLDYGTRPVFIGRTGESSWDGKLGGAVDEASIYSRALSSNEIAAIYNAGSSGKCLPPWPLPVVPSNLVATGISTNQISLTWTETSTNSAAIRFSIERSTASNGTYTAVGIVTNALSYIDTNLMSNTTYYYRLRAGNLSWSAYSTVASATTLINTASLPIESLTLWLKADAGLTLGNTNSPVNLWQDQSGRGNHAIQTSSINQPAWVAGSLNGLPIVRFNGTSSFFNLPNCLTNLTEAEVFVVLKTSVSNNFQALWELGGDRNGRKSYPDNDRTIKDDFGSTGNKFVGVPSQPLTQYHVYEVSSRSNSWSAWINGVLQCQAGNTVAFSATPTLGYAPFYNSYYWDSSYFAGDIAEVLVFGRGLTGDEKAAVGSYLVLKYGLSQYAVDTSVPGTPTNLIAIGVSPNQLRLQWGRTSTNETVFDIERKLGTGGAYQEIGVSTSGVTTFLDTTAYPTNQYFYRVKAKNYFGQSGYPTEISPPVASLTLLSTNMYSFTGSTNLLVAQASDAYSTISQIQLVNNLNTNNVIGAGISVPYTNQWVTTFSSTYSLTALAADTLGNSRYSAALSITTYLDSNGDGIADALQVLQGNDPLNPWIPPALNTNDHTAPVITLLIPTNAIIVP